MDSKKTRTLSKATVATVVAASGVLVAMPQPSSAATFNDLNPYADYYEPVIDLVNRNIATGYADGTFKPNQAITRADAAKMLALSIDVNIANPKNPGFKDVNVNNGNYRYIAALAEAGIINGFTDNTFKPNEPITRGQMAKIITLGFQFGMSSKLNNSFRDVLPTNFAAYYIQTLVDLNVAKGTTTVTFDPFKNVTRAQMATFVWRAEKADRGTPLYTVGDVSGNTIYINGVAHTVASHLRSVINATNKNILNGAYIEGTFANKTLTNITKLTLNASGTSSRLLALDGNYTSFAGELVINGSYVRLKNLNFTGRVEVAEAPRRSLAALRNVRVASIGNLASFIDWDTPTESKNDDFLNPIDNETLKDKTNTSTSPTSKYKERMANVKKYVDFEGSDLRNLVVTADRAFVKVDSEIDRLTVRGDVTNFELYADAKAMYLDNDYNMTVYGVNDIQYVYKNSLKNVKFNTDSTYDYYYVTTKSGFTDLGEFAYINDAIIPKGATVNTTFDDFDTDEPNIGYIEDENGTPVSRDPVGDTIIADVSAPKITQLDVKAGGTIADGTITVDEDGMYYYVIKKANEKAPTISEIKTGEVPLSGSGPVLMDEKVPFQVTGPLENKTDYVLYAIAIDGSDNVSEKKSVAFSTIDNSPPMLTLDKGDKMYGGKRVQFKVKPSEEGTISYLILPSNQNANPTIDEIIQSPTGTKPANEKEISIEAREYGKKPTLSPIQPLTSYDIFAVMVDKSGNKSRTIEKITIITEKEDLENPYVSSNLRPVEGKINVFEFDVNEPLDPESAQKVENYLLSGTAIINIPNQKAIHPSNVELSKDGKTVQLTIPSETALVNGDTIRVTVTTNVKDLAENDFISDLTARPGRGTENVAIYVHSDTLNPTIKIGDIVYSPTESRYLIDIDTSKAGTYYYMIVPNRINFNALKIEPRDFVDEFNPDEITGKFQVNGETIYASKGSGPADLGKITLPPISKPTTSSFDSYSIYMVLKDRSGKISSWDKKFLITDSKPPLVKDVKFTFPTNGSEEYKNKTINISFSADEDGEVYIAAIPKYRKDASGIYSINKDSTDKNYFTSALKLDFARADLRSVSDTLVYSDNSRKQAFESFARKAGKFWKEEFREGIPKVTMENLEAHQEYTFLLGVEDAYGNFTIKEVDNLTPPINSDEPLGPVMEYDWYMDGFAPYIKNNGVIRKNIDGETFTITFNESIMRQNTLDKYNRSLIPNAKPYNLTELFESINNFTNGNLNSNYEFISYTTGTNTTDSSELVFKPKGSATANESINVKMKDTAYDYLGKNTFDINEIGKYVYRNFTINISDFGYPVISDKRNAEAIISIPSTTTFDGNETLNYYYVVVSEGSNDFTIRQVIETVIRPDSNASVINTLAKGKDTVEIYDSRAKPKFFNNVGFKSGDIIFTVAEDKYGNRALAKYVVGP